ncbi:MAG: hypothetical protein DDT23_01307 [candidate division WS2 bacterium]|nr:hypothetical protein [Candidatus Lithacetigena glycinireducens]
MYSVSLMDRTTLLTTLATEGVYTMERAMMTLESRAPSTAIKAIARRVVGKAINPSRIRMMIASSRGT